MSTSITNDYASKLEEARQAAEAARARADEAKASAEKEAAAAQEAQSNADAANKNVQEHQFSYTSLNSKITAKQAELETAMAQLAQLAGSEDDNAISAAQRRVDAIKAELDKLKAEAEREYNELVKAQQDAQTALTKAEIGRTESANAQKELEEAERASTEAEEALAQAEKEAKEAEEAQKAAEASLTKDVEPMTEEEAIANGYTIIRSPQDLANMSLDPKGKYILMCDIDMEGVDWTPVGTYDPNSSKPWANAFSGEFLGNGYSIKNLSVNAAGDSGLNAVGLFGATNGASIRDVILENVQVNAPEDYNEIAAGGLIGISRDTNIDNVTVTGSITGHQGVGGLIGRISNSHGFGKVNLSDIKTDVDINAAFYAGGLVGYIESDEHNSLMIENCHTAGNYTISDSAAGGLIGEAGKTVITVNNCSSSADITKLPSDSSLSWLLETGRIGGVIGNCNGTFISVCNSQYTGQITSDDEFQGDVYGWYMNDSRVSVFELSAGLPVDDILKIDGIENITPVIDPSTGVAHYEISVSTMAGMNRLVDMIETNPALADLVTFNVLFDFESMDEEYVNTSDSQYGVVQHLYEETAPDGTTTVVNDVYIDNETDLETTYNNSYIPLDGDPIELEITQRPSETMIEGLYKANGKYYIYTGETGGEFENYTEVSLQFFFANQKNIIKSRLREDEVHLRETLNDMAKSYQIRIQDILRERFGYTGMDGIPVIQEPEYVALKKKQASGAELTPEEQAKIALFELNYTIMNIVGEATRNEGCGMGGNASFLEKDTGIPLEDEWGRIRYMALDGFEVRQMVDENGELMFDEEGNPRYETLDGEAYDGSHGAVYIVNGYPVTDDDGNFLYTDEEGNTVVRTESEEGEYTYSYQDGTAFEGDTETLQQQLEEHSPKDMYDDIQSQLDELEKLYNEGGAVEP